MKAIETSNLVETLTWTRLTSTANLRSKVKGLKSRLKVKVTENENVKIVSAHIVIKTGLIYVKPRPK